MKAMRDYVFTTPECRVALMLEYFGEKHASPCCKCDICRERSRSRRAKDITKKVAAAMQRFIDANPDGLTADVIARSFPQYREEALDYIRMLVEDGKMTYDGIKFSKT